MAKERRKTLLIDRSFQVKLIIKFIAINVIIMVIFGILMFLFLNSEVEANLKSAHVTFRNVKDMLFPIVVTLSIINVVVASLVIAGFVLLASHKLAGPLYRFQQALKEIGERNLKPQTKIRTGDQFLECSQTLEEVSNMLSGDIGRLMKRVKEMEKLINSGGGEKELTEKSEEISAILTRYNV